MVGDLGLNEFWFERLLGDWAERFLQGFGEGAAGGALSSYHIDRDGAGGTDAYTDGRHAYAPICPSSSSIDPSANCV